MQALNTLRAIDILNANRKFNSYVEQQAQAGNIVAMGDGKYVLSDAFEVVYEYSGEYNKATTFRKTIPFVFKLLPASVSSLTIHPGSIIV